MSAESNKINSSKTAGVNIYKKDANKKMEWSLSGPKTPGKCKILCIAIALPAILLLLAGDASGGSGTDANDNGPTPVDSVDLKRYAGLWYEIAKLSNRFQRKCAGNATVTYKLRDDGKIDVTNRCLKTNGKTMEVKGIAKVGETKSNARLKINFFQIFGLPLFWGDYWIIGLSEDYGYAVVGVPSRKLGWILSRRPALSESDINEVYAILRKQGYDPEDFEMTE